MREGGENWRQADETGKGREGKGRRNAPRNAIFLVCGDCKMLTIFRWRYYNVTI
jgi:hypothetical protein